MVCCNYPQELDVIVSVVGIDDSKSFVWAFLPLPPDFQEEIRTAEPFTVHFLLLCILAPPV